MPDYTQQLPQYSPLQQGMAQLSSMPGLGNYDLYDTLSYQQAQQQQYYQALLAYQQQLAQLYQQALMQQYYDQYADQHDSSTDRGNDAAQDYDQDLAEYLNALQEQQAYGNYYQAPYMINPYMMSQYFENPYISQQPDYSQYNLLDLIGEQQGQQLPQQEQSQGQAVSNYFAGTKAQQAGGSFFDKLTSDEEHKPQWLKNVESITKWVGLPKISAINNMIKDPSFKTVKDVFLGNPIANFLLGDTYDSAERLYRDPSLGNALNLAVNAGLDVGSFFVPALKAPKAVKYGILGANAVKGLLEGGGDEDGVEQARHGIKLIPRKRY